jgi:hypothetical protein
MEENHRLAAGGSDLGIPDIEDAGGDLLELRGTLCSWEERFS